MTRSEPAPATDPPPDATGPVPTPLPRAFFARDAETVARDLLGKTLCHRPDPAPAAGGPGAVQRARIVETEAYVGPHDAAAHTRAGVTPRTRIMFGPAGHAYVYFVYGMHHLLNVVTGQEGDGEAVLVRAVEPLAGLPAETRTDGPGRLTKALGIRVESHDGLDLRGDRLWIGDGPAPDNVAVGPRIGVDFAGDWAHKPLRCWDPESRHISRRPSPKARR